MCYPLQEAVSVGLEARGGGRGGAYAATAAGARVGKGVGQTEEMVGAEDVGAKVKNCSFGLPQSLHGKLLSSYIN